MRKHEGSENYSYAAGPNSSVAGGQLPVFFLITVTLSFSIAGAMSYLGAWPVFPFAGLEMTALGTAFVVIRRRAGDYERIVLGAEGLSVEVREFGRVRRVQVNPAWVRVIVLDAANYELALQMRGENWRIGRHADAAGRRRLAQELNGRLAGWRAWT
ncbi:MAG: DUF2244 domain-containing protein [Rhodocyclaceae bacterium]|nr:DUF2244 domain-containing protein [Rhodocyclaceae bacterium]MBX3671057.1 DUF2244 domain-containing protein [Rhodocyclaceae bacterium]